MQLGSVVLAGVCGMVGLVAGRATRPAPAEVAAAPIHDPPARVISAPPRAAVVGEAPADTDGDDGEGMDVGEAIANAKSQAAAHLAEHNAIRGTITERDSGPAIGATVVVSAPTIGSQVAITDEHGNYLITQVPAGSYTMTVYYNDRTIERTGVVASEFSTTTQDDVIEPVAPVPLDHFEWEGPSDMTTTYSVDDVVVPGRTFEGVLGAAAGVQGDQGVTFSGGTFAENTYIIVE